MLGRGIDQLLPNPANPALDEPAVRDARTYVRLAERANGPIDRPVDFAWPWGDALAVLDRLKPDVRILNLETSITLRGRFAPGKYVHYRMNPGNLAALSAIRPTVCTLANNHSLDFGPIGLRDTLDSLEHARHRRCRRRAQYRRRTPSSNDSRSAIRQCARGGLATSSSGVPLGLGGDVEPSGNLGRPPSERRSSADDVAAELLVSAGPHDITIASIHWGSNWGYEVHEDERRFAHRLIDAGVNIVHGHSSHHPRPLEIYRNRPIFYGCGDLIDDYEGIRATAHSGPNCGCCTSCKWTRAPANSPNFASFPSGSETCAWRRSPERPRPIGWRRSSLASAGTSGPSSRRCPTGCRFAQSNARNAETAKRPGRSCEERPGRFIPC